MTQLLQFPNPPRVGLPEQWYRVLQPVQVPVRANALEYLGVVALPNRKAKLYVVDAGADRVVSRFAAEADALEAIVNQLLASHAIAPHGAAR